MKRSIARNARFVSGGALAAALLLSVAACDTESILDVETPGTLSVDRLGGPANVDLLAAGIAGAYHFGIDTHALYTGLFTDEFVLAGTFPTRREVDERSVLESNGTITGYNEALHQALFHADTTALQFTALLDDEEFASVLPGLNYGIVAGNLYGGLVRTDIAEFWCSSPIRLSASLSSDQIMEQAITKFDATIAESDRALAEDAAGDLDLSAAARAEMAALAGAARVGKARALLWLERDAEAAALAATVPDGFEFYAEYSGASTSLYNDVYTFTWGDTQVIRWTVGAGDTASRFNERFAYYDEWVALDRIAPTPSGFASFDSAIPVHLQLQHPERGSDILIASKAEADMIEAEWAIRDNRPLDADARVNPYRLDWGLAPMTFVGMTQEEALIALARERNRELWLTSERQETLRRYFERDGIDLYPEKPGTQICLPTPEQETDNNPNL